MRLVIDPCSPLAHARIACGGQCRGARHTLYTCDTSTRRFNAHELGHPARHRAWQGFPACWHAPCGGMISRAPRTLIVIAGYRRLWIESSRLGPEGNEKRRRELEFEGVR